MLFMHAIISLEIRHFKRETSMNKTREQKWTRTICSLKILVQNHWVIHDRNTPTAQAVSVWKEKARKTDQRENEAELPLSGLKSLPALPVMSIERVKKKAWSPHLTLEEPRSDGHSATVRGQLLDKKPCVNYQGRFLLQKKGPVALKRQSEPFEGTACLTLLFLVNIRALTVVFPYQRGSVSPSALKAGWERMPLNFPGNLPNRLNER